MDVVGVVDVDAYLTEAYAVASTHCEGLVLVSRGVKGDEEGFRPDPDLADWCEPLIGETLRTMAAEQVQVGASIAKSVQFTKSPQVLGDDKAPAQWVFAVSLQATMREGKVLALAGHEMAWLQGLQGVLV